MRTSDTTRRGVSNEGGLFSPYFLFDLLGRLHRDELDFDGRERERRMLPKVYRRAMARLSADSPFGEVWAHWYRELFAALGLEPQALATPTGTARHGLVPISHAVADKDHGLVLLVDLHPLGTDLDRDHYEVPARMLDVTREPISRAFELALDHQGGMDREAGARFGLLSNGRELRLYQRAGTVARQFLRIEFVALFDADRDDEWTAFWGLMRRDALIPGADGPCFVEKVLDESHRHASKIAEDLRENVVAALEALVQGALDDRSNARLWGGGQPDQATLERLFQEALAYLYRLLFILFAESRDVLPVSSSLVYRDAYSVEHLRDMVERDLAQEDAGKTYFAQTLRTLCRLLRTGYESTAFWLPTLGGLGPEHPDWDARRDDDAPYLTSLFDARRSLLLDACEIPDRAFRTVIRELSLSRPKGRRGQRERYSYADLGVGQLGSIYEGLLAYEPAIVTEETVQVKVSGEVRLVTRRQADEYGLPIMEGTSRPPGSFLLRLWGGRRKGSGSYYTPREITAFLVREALDPIVEPIVQRCAEMNRSEQRRVEEETRRTGRLTPGRPTRVAEEILEIKVCDPAMGSGAFLVQACRYLAESYARALIAEGRDASGRIEPEELARYKRMVADKCLYGVDVNPLAVELAKVSLWLETLADSQPLSFLDAHLRCGNSLVGAPLRNRAGRFDASGLLAIPTEALKLVGKPASEPEKMAEKVRVRQNSQALKDLARAEAGQAAFVFYALRDAGLHEQLAAYMEARRVFEETSGEGSVALLQREEQELRFRESYLAPGSPAHRLKDVCDLWCAAWFWPEAESVELFTTTQYREVAERLLEGESIEPTPHWLSVARDVIRKERFFHWELEFPEVFLRTRPGFDAVLGNPPWEKLSADLGEIAGEYDAHLKTLRGAERDQRLGELLADPTIGSALRERACRRIELARFSREGPWYKDLVFGEVNTFASFAVLAWHFHREAGAMALVLKDAFHLATSLGPLRAEMLTQGRIDLLATADNERKIFDAHHLLRFDLVVARRGESGTTLLISVHRFKTAHDIVAAARVGAEVPLEALLDEGGRPARPIPEIEDPFWLSLLMKCRRSTGAAVRWKRELHSSDDKECWDRALAESSPGPVLGMVNPFDSLGCRPFAWLLPSWEGRSELGKTGWGHYRIAVRSRVNQKDERVLIGAVIPPASATCDLLQVCTIRTTPRDTLVIAALANSLVLDYLARPLVGIKMGPGILNALPWMLGRDDGVVDAITSDAARLTCTRPEFDALAQKAGVESCDMRPADRAAVRAHLDALVARLYGLGPHEFAHVLASFRLLDQDQPALPGEPKSYITRDLVLLEFVTLIGTLVPCDVVSFFADAGSDIARVTGPIRHLEERVDHARAIGAIAYQPARRRSRGTNELDGGIDADSE